MLWQTHAQTVRGVHSCLALYDNKMSRAAHGSAFESTFHTTSSVPIRHYARGQRSCLPDSVIVCRGRNPINIISPEMGRKERAACAMWHGVAFLLSASVRVPCSVGVVLNVLSTEGCGCKACLAFTEDPSHGEGRTWLRLISGIIRKEE